jgi:quercetin dioxygenase-like cupin family protein
MVGSGDVLHIPDVGIRIEILRRAAETDGDLVEFDVIGRPRGIIAVPHVHVANSEHIAVLSGALRLSLAGQDRVLRAGDAIEIPPGVRHSQRAHGTGPHHLRVQWRPAGPTEAFGERLAEMSRNGDFARWGYPRLVPASRFALDFALDPYPTWLPVRIQRAVAETVVGIARAIERIRSRVRPAGRWRA